MVRGRSFNEEIWMDRSEKEGGTDESCEVWKNDEMQLPVRFLPGKNNNNNKAANTIGIECRFLLAYSIRGERGGGEEIEYKNGREESGRPLLHRYCRMNDFRPVNSSGSRLRSLPATRWWEKDGFDRKSSRKKVIRDGLMRRILEINYTLITR